MRLSFDHPEIFEKLIVVDISPKFITNWDNSKFIDGLLQIPIKELKTKAQVRESLSKKIESPKVIDFLMLSLKHNSQNQYEWSFNLDAISEFRDELRGFELDEKLVFNGKTLFIGGTESDYIKSEDLHIISRHFPSSRVEMIEGAGHWVHADKNDEFIDTVINFMMNN